MLGSLDDLLMLLVVLTLWTCARSFANAVNHATQELLKNETMGVPVTYPAFMGHWIQIDKQYKALQHLSSLINRTFGLFYGIFVIAEILFYSSSFNEIFVRQQNNDWSTAFRSAFFFANTATCMILSANIVSQVEMFREFLNMSKPVLPLLEIRGKGEGKPRMLSERYHMPIEHIQMYKDELAAKTVAIKIGNIFPVTYSLVANVS